jgi:uncharacterized membrane protein
MQFFPARQLTVAFAAAYPLVAHLAAARNSVRLTVAAVALLTVSALLNSLLRGRIAAWLAVLVAIAGCWVLARSSLSLLPLYVPPVLIPAFLAWIFGQTLLPGRTPLIEQLVHMLHGPDTVPEPAALVYARRLTLVWTILFVVLALTNLLLAAFAEPEHWSLFANLIAYLIVVTFFVVEYAYRRRRFPRQPYSNMLAFVQRLVGSLPGLLGRAPR